ncbi:phenylacetaldoxime dehydratase family protein [Microbispora sp. H10885]|uniref:phenylacetaldoxime dehydratase family protein n=1 Tax=Microbispora sp. H10885 TaxID=2729110 RepID=UPI00160320C6|nr:phenylacetaldoxime dehydratase family protein [Microbispora sp. H10885]
MPKLRPAGFRNPYPAYSLDLPERLAGVTMRQLAVQHRAGDEAAGVLAGVVGSLHGAHAPVAYEHAAHVDRLGYTNDVILAYWLDGDAEKSWSEEHPLGSWAAPELTAKGGPIGLWTEVLRAPAGHFETSYSYDSPTWGLASQFPAVPNANPQETGCLSARLADLIVSNDDRVQTATLAWFLSLSHLERWAHSHATHLAIFKSAGELIARFAPDIHVTLGHEVYVAPEGGRMEYLNCHDQTGFLPYFPAQYR